MVQEANGMGMGPMSNSTSNIVILRNLGITKNLHKYPLMKMVYSYPPLARRLNVNNDGSVEGSHRPTSYEGAFHNSRGFVVVYFSYPLVFSYSYEDEILE